MRVLISVPAGCPAFPTRLTALRWAAMLRRLGHRVRIAEVPKAADVVVALDPRGGRALEGLDPSVPLLVAPGASRTGTACLERADRIIVPHEGARATLSPELRVKSRVIPPSRPPLPRPVALNESGDIGHAGSSPFVDAVAIGLPERDGADLLPSAASLLSSGSPVRILHVGAGTSPELAQRARVESLAFERYLWLGDRPLREILAIMAGADAAIHPWQTEHAGAIASVAIACGLPLLASRTDATRGLLGRTHPGYFEPSDASALAALLERCEEEAFRGELVRALRPRAPLFGPEREREAWRRLLAELEPRPEVTRAVGPLATVLDVGGPDLQSELARDVRLGLGGHPKRLPCRYLYDAEGSLLFEEICAQPEYYVGRAEIALFERHADDILAECPPRVAICELGSGSAVKTRLLLSAAIARGTRSYAAVDISSSALEESLAALGHRFPGLALTGIAGEYARALPALWERVDSPRLVLWLGSNVGNLNRLEAADFLASLAERMAADDRLLVGIDLRKDPQVIEQAYDDAAGVTARFNLNLLARLNRELDADFDLSAFAHRASYDPRDGRVDMHLVSLRPQTARIGALDMRVSIAAGEAIHTESAYKHSISEIESLVRHAGLRLHARWYDPEGRFVECLLAPRQSSIQESPSRQ